MFHIRNRIGQLASSTTTLIDQNGRPLINDLRQTLRSAQGSMAQLERAIGDARPGIQAFSKKTIPEIGQLVQDLRVMSQSLASVAEKIDQGGAGSILGSPKLPDYKPGKKK